MSYARLFGAVALLALIGLGLWRLYQGGYRAGRDAVQIEWDAERIRRAAAEQTARLAYEERMQDAQQQHDQDQALIDRLHAAAGRLRIGLPACGAAQGSAHPDGGAGLLPAGVDAEFARLQARADRLFARCDQLNIDAIRANAAAP